MTNRDLYHLLLVALILLALLYGAVRLHQARQVERYYWVNVRDA